MLSYHQRLLHLTDWTFNEIKLQRGVGVILGHNEMLHKKIQLEICHSKHRNKTSLLGQNFKLCNQAPNHWLLPVNALLSEIL